VSGFDAAWLALREPADAAARSVALEAALARALAGRGSPLECADLACGTGANLRRLAPHLPGPQQWRLVDTDPALLAEAGRRCAGLRAADGAAVEVAYVQADLAAADLDACCSGAALVTASALLDLVSEAWLDRLAAAIARARAAALFALDYDGRRACEPADADDALAHAAFDAHQRRDKGFGPALGPRAASYAARVLEQRGYRVWRARADWRLGPGDAPLQAELLRGWARAAAEAAPESRETVDAWLGRRLALLDSGRSWLTVGHEDLLATPL
jgi:SAM-dependent methyltransferase